MDNVIGIDIGGTFIKGGVVNNVGEIISFFKIPTPHSRSVVEVSDAICSLVRKLEKETKIKPLKIGVACPGAIDIATGQVLDSSNLHWQNVPLRQILQEKIGVDVRICNDADAALLAELHSGAGQGVRDAVMLTLGTGIGSGVVKDGKLLERIELGHAVIKANGRKCSCGRRGCFEAYASATGLINGGRYAIKRADTTLKAENLSGELIFEYYETDEAAKKTVDGYIENLICGISNCVNIFQPKVLLLGGGVCGGLERFLPYMEDAINKEVAFPVKLAIAKHQNNAGVLGAATLWTDR